MAFQPRVTTTVTSADDVGSVGKKDVRSACEQAWSVKRMADLDISKSVYGSKCAKPDPLTISVAIDEATTRSSEAFDYEFDGMSVFQPPAIPPIPHDFRVGLLVGPSGSGDSVCIQFVAAACCAYVVLRTRLRTRIYLPVSTCVTP